MDTIYFLAFVLLVTLYLFTFWKRFPLHREDQVFSRNRAYYRNWIAYVLHHEEAAIYAVQSLRNSMMAANILATTAIVLIMATINIGLTNNQLDWFYRLMERSHSQLEWQQFKLFLLGGLFSFAFFLFVMSIRFYTHLGYMAAPMQAASSEENQATRQRDAEAYLLRGATCFALGIRMFFFAIPPMFWLGGGIPFVCCTLVILSALLITDHL